jgi:cytidyltransferase-like protein
LTDAERATFQRKIKTPQQLREMLGGCPREKKVIMCHGTFDLVHPGHIRHLIYAKSKASVLVTSLTGDQHISKANFRPFVPQMLRAMNLAALEIVDYVVIDENPTPIENFKIIQPDYFAKGYEYNKGGMHPKTKEEFDALGVPFAGRGRLLDSYIAAMRALWAEEQATVDDEFVSFTRAISLPKPVTGSVPIIIGGHTDAAARRAGRLGDGFFPGRGSPQRLRELIGGMRAAAEQAGRDPDAIEVTAGTLAVFGDDPLGAVAELVEVGVHRVAIPPLAFDPATVGDALADFADRVMSRL